MVHSQGLEIMQTLPLVAGGYRFIPVVFQYSAAIQRRRPIALCASAFVSDVVLLVLARANHHAVGPNQVSGLLSPENGNNADETHIGHWSDENFWIPTRISATRSITAASTVKAPYGIQLSHSLGQLPAILPCVAIKSIQLCPPATFPEASHLHWTRS